MGISCKRDTHLMGTRWASRVNEIRISWERDGHLVAGMDGFAGASPSVLGSLCTLGVAGLWIKRFPTLAKVDKFEEATEPN